ncbi:brain-specific angiogenesis inhibitor 1-associated protein 2-like protein 2 isoform X2 [Acanthochromis polyacanthus]|uniref:BAR/IMD domain containing adaptor protein 2 like 2a n=1 Tax=Acanthochromis polyacanthus TaxID=80966 RepID=A0A3Q1FZH2_9TELE|nr:brain-specific angiogenesis inhibitor 1-associated protein 2-like protein 2 isoform X2 [Acanthochromis polyacanthus]XP_022051649.1 brain-specific angiogenesis inhibitor 1-associated protein 2-like protein 2 isoform X2 [Acanthochromis polyacanthus]XP_051798347.1 brain-specific angiogenesis inhibitor 1-associated protein 2-like protein 2 isoform X2 [Acanthochromis polyacanthus]XP_051798350.1 brain-specific angiogenesis inhibitor 1-associated protein 2-like protein 2 isoform X2 [Acanthochromis p
MAGMNSDQLHRSTLEIYSSLMDEFNPSIQKLVSLGNSYVQAFKALTVTSEAYFNALSKIGEKGFHTASSRSIGDVLIQISESQRRLTLELEGMFHWFNQEILQQMDSNAQSDRDFLSNSREKYKHEVHNQATALERQLRRGINQSSSDYVQFLRESHSQALVEEERRYRFLAERHCSLIHSIAHLMKKTGGGLQQKADAWMEEVGATRRPEPRRPSSPEHTLGRRKGEEVRRNREEPELGSIPSRAPSPQGSISRFSMDPVGGGYLGRSMKALVAHEPSSSQPTLLPFSRGQIITVMVRQPRNGWLYGRTDGSSRQGWFPGSFVEPVDDPPQSPSLWNSSLRSNSSMSNLQEHSGTSSQNVAPPPPPPPPPLSSSSSKHSETRPMAAAPGKRAETQGSERKQRSPPPGPPELFPRGTNPFATVKLKPTVTNDKSAPRLYRR